VNVSEEGVIFNIQRFSVQDGPGIRTTVFFKGCPLRCPWCSNPESQRPYLEVAHRDTLCDQCGRCVEACDLKAISLADKGVRIDREICNNCGKCVSVCSPHALRVLGQVLSVEDVFHEIERDELYYRNSKGGVTASGGEPLSQSHFVSALFKRCQEAGIHTTLDTCGYATRPVLERVLEYTDLVLYDLKLVDPVIHRKVTKKPNQSILRNVRYIVEREIPIIIRVAVIPGFTGTAENIRAVASFVEELDGDISVNLLPYHRFGTGKYKMLDRKYELSRLKAPSEEELRTIVDIFQSFALPCEIVR
jgi:pyruvate formate lyase activating enzyme